MQVPDVPYRMTIDRSAGSVDVQSVEHDDDARRTIDVQVAAGHVDIAAG